jgi:polysaccharide export outer membrane protein
MKRDHWFIVVVLLVLASTDGWGQTAPAPDSGAGAAAQPLAPGDAIQLAFWREPQLSGDYPIDETGMVVLPLLGARQVSQLSPAELKRTLLEEYAQQVRNQEVRITLLRRIRILGAVKNPGLYRVDPTMTLGDALALAGGTTSEGRLKGIKMFRNGRQVRTRLDINLQLLEQIRSGDQLLVPERSWFARNAPYMIAATISAAGIIIARAVP